MRSRARLLVVSIVAAGAAVAPGGVSAPAAGAEPAITVTEMGTGAVNFLPRQINGRGQVLGVRPAASGGNDISLYQNGRFVRLAAAPPGGPPLNAYLNERGEVAYSVAWWLGTFPIRCTNQRWAAGVVTAVSVLDTACTSGLNDKGEVLLNGILADDTSWWLRSSV